jgi:hypothetical protein
VATGIEDAEDTSQKSQSGNYEDHESISEALQEILNTEQGQNNLKSIKRLFETAKKSGFGGRTPPRKRSGLSFP